MSDNKKGFTLVELMIVFCLIAILASIAIPAYQTHGIKAEIIRKNEAGISLTSEESDFVQKNKDMFSDMEKKQDDSLMNIVVSKVLSNEKLTIDEKEYFNKYQNEIIDAVSKNRKSQQSVQATAATISASPTNPIEISTDKGILKKIPSVPPIK